MLTKLYGRWGYPLNHALKRDGVNEAIRNLSRTQWLEPPAIEALQQGKLQRLLHFAYEYTPYYARLMRELGCGPEQLADPAGIRRLPPLTKDLIRGEYNDVRATPDGGRAGYSNSTSGSTGESLEFLTDCRSHAYRLADEHRGKTWAGLRPGDRLITLWGAPIEVNRSRALRGRIRSLIAGHRILSSHDLSPSRMHEYHRTINRFRPKLLIAYPSALEAFTRYCLETGLELGPYPKSILTSGETLWDDQRKLFEEVFGCPVFNRYGSREMGLVAQECPAHEGLHVSNDRLYVEIVDDHGEPCPPGVWGELLVTDLESHAMPLIRYRIADRAAWSTESNCPCGRGLPLLQGVEGRSMDIVRTPDGHGVGGTFWTLLLKSRPGLKRFQVVQNALGAITIRYVPESDLNPEIFADFDREIEKRLGRSVPITFEAVEEIGTTASGKHRLIISEFAPVTQPMGR